MKISPLFTRAHLSVESNDTSTFFTPVRFKNEFPSMVIIEILDSVQSTTVNDPHDVIRSIVWETVDLLGSPR